MTEEPPRHPTHPSKPNKVRDPGVVQFSIATKTRAQETHAQSKAFALGPPRSLNAAFSVVLFGIADVECHCSVCRSVPHSER